MSLSHSFVRTLLVALTLALIQGVVNTFVIFLSRVIGHFVDRVVFKNESGHVPAF